MGLTTQHITVINLLYLIELQLFKFQVQNNVAFELKYKHFCLFSIHWKNMHTLP